MLSFTYFKKKDSVRGFGIVRRFEKPMSKRLVIFCDGTWNTPDQKDGGVVRPSNVVKLSRAVLPEAADGTLQVTFYDPGVGTGNFLDRWTGGAFGKGISKNIQDAYRFLVHNFVEGDEIYLFGFSRGAYTARSTGGLIRNCGILRKSCADQIEAAYDMYRRPDVAPDSKEATTFCSAHSVETRVHCIGVWDTVGALGIPVSGLRWLTMRKHQFHDVNLSRSVKHAYHALAIDERRRPFAPTLWETRAGPEQKVEQVWFSGVHTNVGGGYKDSGLSDLAFMWMKEKAEGAGLEFDEDYIEENIRPDANGVVRNSKKGIYRLIPDFHRVIGALQSAREDVRSEAIERFKRDPEYKPFNLQQYLARFGL